MWHLSSPGLVSSWDSGTNAAMAAEPLLSLQECFQFVIVELHGDDMVSSFCSDQNIDQMLLAIAEDGGGS